MGEDRPHAVRDLQRHSRALRYRHEDRHYNMFVNFHRESSKYAWSFSTAAFLAQMLNQTWPDNFLDGSGRGKLNLLSITVDCRGVACADSFPGYGDCPIGASSSRSWCGMGDIGIDDHIWYEKLRSFTVLKKVISPWTRKSAMGYMKGPTKKTQQVMPSIYGLIFIHKFMWYCC